MEYNADSVETLFVISKKADTTNNMNGNKNGTDRNSAADTGDNIPLGMIFVFLIISGAALVILESKKRKY